MKTIFFIKEVDAKPEVLASWLREQTKKIPATSGDSRLFEKRESNSIYLDKKLFTPEPIFIGKEGEIEIYGVLSKRDIQKHEDYVSFSMGGIIVKHSIDDEGRKHSVIEVIRRNNQEYVVQIDFWPTEGGSWVEGKCAHDAFEEDVLRMGEGIVKNFGGILRVEIKPTGTNWSADSRDYIKFNNHDKRGRRSEYRQIKRDEIVEAWLNKNENDARTLEVFLVDYVGEKETSWSIEPKPNISVSTFYNWRSDYLKRNKDMSI